MERDSLFYLGSTLSNSNGESLFDTDLISRSSLQDTQAGYRCAKKKNNKVQMYVKLVINNYLRMYYYYKRFKNV